MILAWIANGCVLLFVVWACVWLRRQRRRRRAQQQSRELLISPMAGLAMGAMLLGFQAIVQPQVRHAIVEMQEEKSWDDESGEEPPGGRAFHEALRGIRAGEEINALTVRTDSPGPTAAG
jgi:hypothetical protein